MSIPSLRIAARRRSVSRAAAPGVSASPGSSSRPASRAFVSNRSPGITPRRTSWPRALRSEEHTSELQSPCNLVCRLLLEKKKIITNPAAQDLLIQDHGQLQPVAVNHLLALHPEPDLPSDHHSLEQLDPGVAASAVIVGGL